MGRVIGRPGSIVDGVSGDRIVRRTVDIDAVPSASEDVIAGHYVVYRGAASVVEGNSLTGRPCDGVSGDEIVLGDVCAIANDDAPAVAVEIIAGHGHSLRPDEINSVVRAREDGVSGDNLSPAVAQIKTVAIASADITGHRVVVACAVVDSVTV